MKTQGGHRAILDKKRCESRETAEIHNHQYAQYYGLLTVGAPEVEIRVITSVASDDLPNIKANQHCHGQHFQYQAVVVVQCQILSPRTASKHVPADLMERHPSLMTAIATKNCCGRGKGVLVEKSFHFVCITSFFSIFCVTPQTYQRTCVGSSANKIASSHVHHLHFISNSPLTHPRTHPRTRSLTLWHFPSLSVTHTLACTVVHSLIIL